MITESFQPDAWRRASGHRAATMGPATTLMLDLADLAPGDRVLDLGAGTGEQTLLVAERVGPFGSILATDVSPAMVQAIRETAQTAGLANVEAEVLDTSDLRLPEASFDAAVARNSLMFVSSLPEALKGIRRALKHGARFATTVWSSLERNPFQALQLEVLTRVAAGGQPLLRRAFSLSDPDALRRAFAEAGFQDVTLQTAPADREFPSAEHAARAQRDLGVLNPTLARLTPEQVDQFWEELTRAYGALVGARGFHAPGELLVVGSTA